MDEESPIANGNPTDDSLIKDGPNDNRQRIWQTVSLIPKGCVASYGQIAELAGLARAARLVGNTLRNLPKDSSLPWHRVVNSQGKLSFPLGSSAYLRQKNLLVDEGVEFRSEKIPLARFRWRP